MADEILQERERIVNSFPNTPQPFFVGNIVIVQPSDRELHLEQTESWERTPCILEYPTVNEYIFKK